MQISLFLIHNHRQIIKSVAKTCGLLGPGIGGSKKVYDLKLNWSPGILGNCGRDGRSGKWPIAIFFLLMSRLIGFVT